MIVARVYPKLDADHLDVREIARRLRGAFPSIEIDWEAGNDWVATKRKELVAMGAPDVILLSHDSLRNNTAVVKLELADFPGPEARFFICPDSRIEVKTAEGNKTFLQAVSQKIAAGLDYNYRLVED